MMKETTLSTGEKVWIEGEDENARLFFSSDFGVRSIVGQTLPIDSRDYRYTHGGALYREACEKLGVV